MEQVNSTEYGNIPEDVLELEIGEFYNNDTGFSRCSLRSELDTLDEEVIHAEWDVEQTPNEIYPRLISFVAWTESNVAVLADDNFGEKTLLVIPRNPNNS